VSQSGSGFGVAILVLFVGFLGWLSGMTTEKSRSGQGSPHQGPRQSPPPNGYPHGPGTSGGGAHTGSGGSSGSGPQWGSNTRGAGRPGSGPTPSPSGAGHGARQHSYGQSSNEQTPEPNPRSESSSTAWEKAREETRKREEERRRNEESKKRQEEDRKMKEETERASRAAAEKEKWEQMRARERDARERDARERVAKERIAKEKEEKAVKEAKANAEREERLKAAKERAERLRADRAASAKASSDKAQSEKGPQVFGVGERLDPYSLAPAGAKSVYGGSSPSPKTPSPQKYRQPFAASYDGTATDTAFRPYDTPPSARNKPSPSVFSAYSSSYAPSDSTAQTTPPNSHAGPYSTDDPEKIIIRGAYKFTDSFPKPIASVKPMDSNISDGLIMKIDNEGVFLDDDRKYVPLRQWDIKLWTMKGIEVSFGPASSLSPLCVLTICSPFPNQASTSYEHWSVILTIPKWYILFQMSRLGSSPAASSA
jgi:hypothetical protein